MALPSQPFLAFVTEDGAWTYTRLPMGVTTAPAFFQRVMLRILATSHLHICVVYVDDVTVFGRSAVQCWDNALIVMRQLIGAGMNLSARKCKFLLQEIEILGHRFGKGRFAPNCVKL